MEQSNKAAFSPLFMAIEDLDRPDAIFIARCRHCLQKFSVEDAVAFKDFSCPSCENPLIVPKIFSDYWLFSRTRTSDRNRIYRALDPMLDRVVAIKVVKPEKYDEEEAERRIHRLYYDAQIQAQLNFENVVEVYRCCNIDNREAKVMELLSGGTLSFSEDPELRTDPLLVLTAFAGVANLLRHASTFNICHGQISPNNLLFNDIGVLKLLNFRPATDATPENILSQKEFIFLAPERLLDYESTPQADIYSLASILYTQLSNHHPMGYIEEDCGELDLVNRQQRNPVPSLKGRCDFSDDELFTLINNMLSPRPADRPNYDEIIAGLNQAATKIARKRNFQMARQRISEKLHAGIKYLQNSEFTQQG